MAAINFDRERDWFKRFRYIYWILTRRTTIRCDHCKRIEMLETRLGPLFLDQQLHFYEKHAYCTETDPKRRVMFYPLTLSYDYQKRMLTSAREARNALFSVDMPGYIHVNTNKLVCGQCGEEDIILGLSMKERDIHLWEFVKLHQFCKTQKRVSRGEII